MNEEMQKRLTRLLEAMKKMPAGWFTSDPLQQQERQMTICNWIHFSNHEGEAPNNWGVTVSSGVIGFFLTRDQTKQQAQALCKAINALLSGKKAVVVMEEKTTKDPP